MAQMTDSELLVLKARALAARVSGAHLAHAEAHIMELVDEVLAHRRGQQEKEGKIALREIPLNAAHALKAVKETGIPMTVARTVEELADQLQKDLSGEKDAHDLAVEKIEAETARRASESVEVTEEVKVSKSSKGSKKGK